ncbi:MAG: pentapeptide repeat-containing protein [Chloroflexales bacterium]
MVHINNSQMDNLNIGYIAGRDVIISAAQATPHEPPLMVPPTPDQEHYVSRGQAQEHLVATLRSNEDSRLIHLYGSSGVGKTTLAAYAANQAMTMFPAGILWESVEHYQEPSDLLLRFLGTLDPVWFQRAPQAQSLLRDIFWNGVRGKRLLIVFDNVANSACLPPLLPINQHLPSGICLLVISYQRLRFPPGIEPNVVISLDGFERESDIELLLHGQLGASYVRLHRETLLALARHVDNNPLQLLSLAHDLAERRTTPQALLRAIEQDHSGTDAMTAGRGMEISIRDLDSEPHDLLLLLGAFGASSWRAEALAAAAMGNLVTLRGPLAELRERGLVQQHADGRLYLNLQARQIARRLFEARDRYHRDATFACLARHFLDLAQDTVAALLVRPDLHSAAGTPPERYDEAFIGAFRSAMLPELPHLRRIFDWALEREDWSLLLRFADVAYTTLLSYLMASGRESRFPLTLATLVEPLVSPRGDQPQVRFQTLIGAIEWSCEPHPDQAMPTDDRDPHPTHSDATPVSVRHLEVSLAIMVGTVIDGTFEAARLVDTQWVGVRAIGLILRDCIMIGSRMVACDLRQATWCGGEAQQCDLTGTILDYALIRKVELHRAVLRDASLKGAVLEQTRLRGADLRGADLTGAILHDVDLRNADLRGAILTLAELKTVRLKDARLEGVQWAGAKLDTCSFSDQAAEEEAKRAAQEPPPLLTSVVRKRERKLEAFQGEDQTHFPLADLRGAEIEAIKRKGMNLHGADLRAAKLSRCQFLSANLEGANLRAAHLPGIYLSHANLRDADLRGAVLQGAFLENAVLTRAALRGADLSGSHFTCASLLAANLHGADLSRADLSHAILTDIDLRQACLRHCRLEQADLTGANLSDADLTGAYLQGANLTSAWLINADLRDSEVTLEQLARTAQRHGLRLSHWTVMTLAGMYEGARALEPEAIMDHAPLAGPDGAATFKPEKMLCLAHLTGEYRNVSLVGRELFGAEITGLFEDSDLCGADLRYAALRGRFFATPFEQCQLTNACISGTVMGVRFDRANLSNTVINGTLTDCSFRGADLTGACLARANLVCCDFTNCVGLEDAQLRLANRLRGVKLPNGDRYVGAFDCPGDLEDAHNRHVDPDKLIEQFYQFDQLPSRPGT